MTAKELIEELQQVSPDTEVSFQMGDGCCGDWLDMKVQFVEASIHETFQLMQIRLEPLKGFTSCIKAGQTKRFIDSLYEKKD